MASLKPKTEKQLLKFWNKTEKAHYGTAIAKKSGKRKTTVKRPKRVVAKTKVKTKAPRTVPLKAPPGLPKLPKF